MTVGNAEELADAKGEKASVHLRLSLFILTLD
jgi:hypothetical protein